MFVLALTCGVIRTRGCFHSGESNGRGSGSKTSRTAREICAEGGGRCNWTLHFQLARGDSRKTPLFVLSPNCLLLLEDQSTRLAKAVPAGGHYLSIIEGLDEIIHY